MRTRALWRGLAVASAFLAGAGLWMTTARAFVPSCEKELAAAYPTLLKGDLSACNERTGPLPAIARADINKFARRLRGTWELDNRTIHGITIDNKSRQARFYFDIENTGAARAVGAALLLDQPGSNWGSASSKAAFWGVGIGQPEAGRVSLRMQGEALGSYEQVRVPDIEDAAFIHFKNAFVAVDKASPAAQGWDKIVLLENSLTYVSCPAGVVERYTKVSGDRPSIEGLPLQSYWERLRDRKGSVAVQELLPRPTSRGGQDD